MSLQIASLLCAFDLLVLFRQHVLLRHVFLVFGVWHGVASGIIMFTGNHFVYLGPFEFSFGFSDCSSTFVKTAVESLWGLH